MSKFLCVDLGTTTGFAVGSAGHVFSGTWELKAGRFESSGMRFVKLRKALNDVHVAYSITQVFFEEVRRHRGVDAAHAYGGYLATLTEWCLDNDVPYSGVPVGTIKKAWCGNGNASKEMMVAEAQRRGFRPVDDNEADALAIFHWALSEYAASAPAEKVAA